ncbi:MAG: non-ribosomal peptide synthetase [Pseudomonadota bacterium]
MAEPPQLVNHFPSLNAVLHERAQGDRCLTHIFGEHDERVVSYSELHERALGILHFLQLQGVKAGDHVVLYCKDNEQFVDAFWACLYGGIVPVPVAVGISDEHRRKLLRITSLLGNAWLYTEEALFNRLLVFDAEQDSSERRVDSLRNRLLLVDRIHDLRDHGTLFSASLADVAFIQFSSGSTAEPKGVVLSHGNLLANIEGMATAARFTEDDVSLSWMPLTHDMGLIGYHLLFVAVNAHSAIMPTDLFVRRPLLWLLKAAEKRSTVLCSPNFGYQHFLKVFASKGLPDDLDLSAVRTICNGAEPIDVGLCDRFLEAMAPYRLPNTAMNTVYGLAEASLCVTMPEPERRVREVALAPHRLTIGEPVEVKPAGTPGALRFAALGTPVRHCRMRIADNDGEAVADGIVGHVLIKGANVTCGYYRNDAATEAATRAGGWLDTGDVGVIVDGELLITGREKDILFVHGQNVYPHDLERLVQHEPGLELGKVAIAGAYTPGKPDQQVILFIVHRKGLEEFAELAGRARRIIGEQGGVEITHAVPVQRIPKTTSGKMQRSALAAGYVAGEYAEVLQEIDALQQQNATGDEALNDIERQLQAICSDVITDKSVGLDDDLFELGTSSLALSEIHARVDDLWPGKLELTDMFDYPTLRLLAERCAQDD